MLTPGEQGEAGTAMTVNPLQIRLRAKKLGVLIADARIAAGKQITECARAIGVQPSEFENYELG